MFLTSVIHTVSLLSEHLVVRLVKFLGVVLYYISIYCPTEVTQWWEPFSLDQHRLVGMSCFVGMCCDK